MILEPQGPWAEAFGRVCLTMSDELPAVPHREYEITMTCEAFAFSASKTYQPFPIQYGHLNPDGVRAKIALGRMFRKWHRLATYVRIEGYCLRHLVGDGAMFIHFGELDPIFKAALFNVCVTQNPGVSNVSDGSTDHRTVHVLPDPWHGRNRDGFRHSDLPNEWLARADGTLVGICRGLFEPAAWAESEAAAYSGNTTFHPHAVTPLACAVLADACDEAGMHQTVGEMLRAGGAPAAQMLLSIRGAETFRSGTVRLSEFARRPGQDGLAADLLENWPAHLGRPRTTERLFDPWPGK